jgi:predicted Zn-dependent peptidase
MVRTVLVLAVVAAIGGLVYVQTRPSPPDPGAAAMAEALAVHTNALKTAMDEECSEARDKLKAWSRLREAGTPSPDDNKKTRKTLRALVKGGCRGHG